MHEESTAKKGRAGWMALFGVLAIATIAYFAFGGKLGGPSDEDGSMETAARPADRRLKQTPFHHDHQHDLARKLGQYREGDGGIDFPFKVTLGTAVSESSSSVPTNKEFAKGSKIRARFGGAQQCCSAASYNDPTTTVRWSAWGEPAAARGANRAVTIPCGTKVILDASSTGGEALAKGLIIKGTLEVLDEGGTYDVETAYVYNCGVLRAHLKSGKTKLTFTLVGHEKIALEGKAGFSTKGFVTQGGTTDLQGSLCNRTTWTTLAKTADAGATELHLAEPVTWAVGTQFMVASTDFKGTQTEVATVTAVSDGGKTLAIKAGLVYPHAGVAPITAEVGALTRNIKITSEAACRAIPNAEAPNKPMCGHFVVDHTDHAIVCGVEVTNMGKPVGFRAPCSN